MEELGIEYEEYEEITIGVCVYFKSENNIFAAISEYEPGEIVGEYVNNQPIFNKVYEFVKNGQSYYVGISDSHIIYESKNKQPGSILGKLVDGQPEWH